MKNFIKIIRWPNLLMIAVTMCLMRYCVVYPFLDNMPILRGLEAEVYMLELQFSSLYFALLVLSVVLIAAAGYIINDYFDIHIDKINKPTRIIVDNTISWKKLKKVYYAFNIIGNLIGFYLSYSIKIWQLGFVFPLFTGLLYYYSMSYKRYFLIGNIIIAISVAIVPVLTGLFELVPVMRYYQELIINYDINFYIIMRWCIGFGYFAFITNLLREIIKDIVDKQGDSTFGSNTVPIALGDKGAKTFVVALCLFEIASVFYIYFNYINNYLSLVFILFLSAILLFLSVIIILAKEKKDYIFAEMFAKMIMVYGLLYSAIVFYQYNQIDLSKIIE
jgi:4-hydroxybenzoate polyprenyltransferase